MDCIIALPGQLFRSTQIPACLWFLSRGQRRDRQGETLFIDARKLGYMLDRTRRDLSAEAISRMSDTYHAWRGFCKSAALEEIRRLEERGCEARTWPRNNEETRHARRSAPTALAATRPVRADPESSRFKRR